MISRRRRQRTETATAFDAHASSMAIDGDPCDVCEPYGTIDGKPCAICGGIGVVVRPKALPKKDGE